MNSIITKNVKFARKSISIRTLGRGFCYPTTLEVTPAIRRRNAVTAVALLVSVGGVYYAAMAAMKESTDDINAIIEMETLENEKKSA